MPFWKLERRDHVRPDEMRACIARAGTAREARHLAGQNAGDEGAAVWLDTERATCKLVPWEGPSAVLLTDVFEG